MSEKDYYAILGVDGSAGAQEIKAAYRKLAFQFHPDRNRADSAGIEQMKAINEAYAVLSHPEKKAEYDRMRRQFGSTAYREFRQSYSDQDIFRGSDIHQVFEEMARAFNLRSGDDIFREFYGQGFRSFEFKRPGVFARGFIFSSGRGRPISRPKSSLPKGYVGRISRLLLEKMAGIRLPQRGKDRQDEIRIAPELAGKGGPYAYFVKEQSKKLVVKVPEGVRDGQRIRLAGMGSPGKGGATAGDLYLTVRIRKPLLQKIKDYFGGNP